MLSIDKGYYKYIYYLSFCHPIHIIITYIRKRYLCCYLNILLMLSSINYWRNPILKSIHHYIDFFVVFLNIIHYLYIYILSPSILLTIILLSIAIIYIIEEYYLTYNNYILITILHSLIHILTSITSCLICYI
jgi:hypothetical protein